MSRVEENTRDKLKALLDEPAVQSWSAVMDCYRSIYSFMTDCLKAENSSIPRFQIMFHLYFSGPLLPVELALKTDGTRANISTFIQRLLNSKTIEPYPGSQSLKRPAYQLTPLGKQEFEGYFPKHVGNLKKIVTPLPNDDIARLLEIGKKIRGLKESQK